MKLLSLEPESSASANSAIPAKKMVGRDGFEPSKSVTADLQSAPFGHSGTYPYEVGAGEGNRTPNLLITNQLLCQLSYASVVSMVNEQRKKMATRKGLEPSTSSVTGWHSNRLNYRAVKYGGPSGFRTPDRAVMSRLL